ncbi:MAG: PEGA domain-containing protein, partial [Bacteroidales bacterium]
MPRKHLIFTLLFVIIAFTGKTQNISVKSFKALPGDQTARVHEPVKDQNGEKCALIKVVTTQEGFIWEGGTLGITEVKKEAGEYWVYVPRGSKKITIKHEDLGVLRNYVYPEAIKEATVYEMKLTTGEVKTVVEEKELAAQWLVIQTDPEEANVFIDDKLAGKTPFQRKYEEGEYTYRIEKRNYHNKAGKVTLEDEKKRLDFTLKPRFGNIEVTSAPEDGIMIYLDDENTGKKTPATLEEVSSGEHTIKLQSRWFQPQSKQVTVEDAQTATVNFELEKAYANITVQSDPPADILVDGEKKGNGNWQGRLMEGIYTIKAEKEKYYSQSEQLKVTAGEEETVSFDLEGKTGNADVVTTPMDAEVYLEGEKQGKTPLTLKDLLIGDYDLKLKKEDFGTVTKSFSIQEDETIQVEEQLPEGKKITITSQPSGAELYIDGEHAGTTPYEAELGFGSYRVKLVNGERTKTGNINITQGGKDTWEFEVLKEGTFTDSRDGQTYEWVR